MLVIVYIYYTYRRDQLAATLIERVASLQKAEGLSDRAFASKLGLSNGQWSGIKTGRNEMGLKTLTAISEHYPGLKGDIERYWLSLLWETPRENIA
jgi:transcriptional regulator with XRE-family HTH domain